MLRELHILWHTGGPVLWALAGLSVGLWWMIARRWQVLRALARTPGTDPAMHRWREEALRTYARSIRSVVKVAPLLGLLGTVSGMIQTFSALAEGAGGEASVAAGISEALLTTQLGLVIAVPGVLVSRLLDRRAEALRERWSNTPATVEGAS